jgi:peptidoglycan hydrolase CwlO-like protein
MTNNERDNQRLNFLFNCCKDITGPLHVELDKKQKEYLPWQKKLDDIQSKIDICQSEYNMLTERSKTANEELDRAKQNLEMMSQTLEERVYHSIHSLIH